MNLRPDCCTECRRLRAISDALDGFVSEPDPCVDRERLRDIRELCQTLGHGSTLRDFLLYASALGGSPEVEYEGEVVTSSVYDEAFARDCEPGAMREATGRMVGSYLNTALRAFEARLRGGTP